MNSQILDIIKSPWANTQGLNLIKTTNNPSVAWWGVGQLAKLLVHHAHKKNNKHKPDKHIVGKTKPPIITKLATILTVANRQYPYPPLVRNSILRTSTNPY